MKPAVPMHDSTLRTRVRAGALICLGIITTLVGERLFRATEVYGLLPVDGMDPLEQLIRPGWYWVSWSLVPSAVLTFLSASLLVSALFLLWRRKTGPQTRSLLRVSARVVAGLLAVHSFATLQALMHIENTATELIADRTLSSFNVTYFFGWATPYIMALAACPLALFAAARALDEGHVATARVWGGSLLVAGLLGISTGSRPHPRCQPRRFFNRACRIVDGHAPQSPHRSELPHMGMWRHDWSMGARRARWLSSLGGERREEGRRECGERAERLRLARRCGCVGAWRGPCAGHAIPPYLRDASTNSRATFPGCTEDPYTSTSGRYLRPGTSTRLPPFVSVSMRARLYGAYAGDS